MELPTSAADAVAFLDTLAPSTIKMGLERLAGVLATLGNPERDVPALHVAGTNGKGSACAFAESILRAHGSRVGLFTSPHLLRVNERVRVDGVDISDEVLGQRILEILERAPAAATELTYFEFGTLIAFWHFSREKLDVAVLETGLGGRLDATNLCVPKVTAITSLGLDHQEYLGDTLAKVAGEKAGIFKPGVPAVTAPQPSEAMAVLKARAGVLGIPLREVSPETLPLALRGEHQRLNAAVARAAVEALGMSVSADAIARGLASARWPGRLEEVLAEPTVVLDGAHNPQGAKALVRALETLYPGRPVRLVFGVFADKDYALMMAALFSRAKALYLTSLPGPRALPPARYEALARSMCPAVQTFASTAAALEAACAGAEGKDVVVAAGSLVLVGEATAWMAQRGGHP